MRRRSFSSSGASRRRMPEIDPHIAVLRIHAIHVVALFVRHHLERQLVVVAQKQRPLAGFRNRRRQLQNVGDRIAVLHARGHEEPRHHRKVKCHVAFVAGSEIGDGVFGPLVGLGQQHAAGVAAVDVRAQLLQKGVRLRKVLAVGALALVRGTGTASSRRPSTPMSSQKSTAFSMAPRTSGLSKFRSGWCE